MKTIIKKPEATGLLAFWFSDDETESPIYYYTIDVKTINVDTYQKENVYKINKVDFVSGEYEHMETLREFRTNNHSIKPMIDKIIERYKNIEIQIDSEVQKTILNTLQTASKNQIQSIAFPPMGTGFYGIPLELSARVMYEAINTHLSGDTNLEKVVICVYDQREYKAFQKVFVNF